MRYMLKIYYNTPSILYSKKQDSHKYSHKPKKQNKKLRQLRKRNINKKPKITKIRT